MKHIKRFNEVDDINEGMKEWIISGALALASIGGVRGQNLDKGREYSTTQSKSDISIKLDFDNEFRSGNYKHSKIDADSIKKKLSDIAKFVKNNAKKDIIINIKSSESQVPNVDIETGKRLPQGALADRRAMNTKELIDDFMKALIDSGEYKGNYRIDTTTKIGITSYKQGVDDRYDTKYTQEQSVGVNVSATKEIITKSEDFAAYAKGKERIFMNGHGIGDISYKTKSTTTIRNTGDVYGSDVLFRTLSSERVFAETGKMHNGKTYLIPSNWWNQATTSNSITPAQFEYIKANFETSH